MTEINLEVISSIIIGVFASYIASKIFLYSNNKKNKPIISISDKLIKSARNDKTPSLNIKLINKTNQDLINVHIVVEDLSNLSPEGSIPLISLNYLTDRKLMYIKKFDIKDKNAEYAHRTNLFIENGDIQKECDKHKIIRISVVASCPYYNTSSIITKDYEVATDIMDKKYRFNTGNSLSVS
jgi:hypothetical protein